MADELSFLTEILQWIGDSPFRLFSSLCLFISCIAYLLFKDQSPAYRMVALILLLFGAGGIGYSVLVDSESDSTGLARIQNAISQTVTDRRGSGCIERYSVVVASIAASNLDDIEIQTVNSIIQDALKTAKFAQSEAAHTHMMGCVPNSVIGRGFVPQCQSAADAFYEIAPAILRGDLSAARENANLSERIFQNCGL